MTIFAKIGLGIMLALSFVEVAQYSYHKGAARYATEVDGVPRTMLQKVMIPNGCQISSINAQGEYEAYCVMQKFAPWSDILVLAIKRGDKVEAHSILIYLYREQYWVYDINAGCYPIGDDNIRAEQATDVVKLIKNYQIKTAWWVEDWKKEWK